jgi:hypothetical protein
MIVEFNKSLFRTMTPQSSIITMATIMAVEVVDTTRVINNSKTIRVATMIIRVVTMAGTTMVVATITEEDMIMAADMTVVVALMGAGAILVVAGATLVVAITDPQRHGSKEQSLLYTFYFTASEIISMTINKTDQ